ncbi:MAG: magnesium transporter, partial [Clostridia bacterium]|nr:magnesium transporter [Clostridia bacterium]
MNDNFEQIFELIEERKFQTLKPILIDLHPADIASIISQASDKDTPIIFRLLPKDVAADTFVELDSEDQEFLIKSFSDKELKSILDELFLDDTVDMIEEMPANVVRRILKHSDPETRKEINELLQYPDDSAGSIMTTEFIALKANLTVNNAISYIKKQGADSETLYTCYVVDAGRKLLGCVSLKDILFADRDDIIGEMMEDNVISVYTLDDIEDVANKFQKYDFEVIPVVDKEDRLVGIITVDDAVDVIVDEATEDIQIMNALAP